MNRQEQRWDHLSVAYMTSWIFGIAIFAAAILVIFAGPQTDATVAQKITPQTLGEPLSELSTSGQAQREFAPER